MKSDLMSPFAVTTVRRYCAISVLTCLSWSVGVSAAQTTPVGVDRGVNEWLLRMHQAGKNKTYLGTYVVSSDMGISTAKIWHACDGVQQMERIESLTGTARSTIRHNDQVLTYLPDSKTAVVEKRENLGLFPRLLSGVAISDFYFVKLGALDRVAGLDAQTLELTPKDTWRFGYRVWLEKNSGLVMKLQTIDPEGRLLEEAAFSDIQLDAPVNMNHIAKLMKANTDESKGVKIIKPNRVKTTAAALGWTLKEQVPGFKPTSCYTRGFDSDSKRAAQETAMQWTFSDGLATVSVFTETYDKHKHMQEIGGRAGATQSLTRRLDAYWLTLVGEVPPATLKALANSIERKK